MILYFAFFGFHQIPVMLMTYPLMFVLYRYLLRGKRHVGKWLLLFNVVHIFLTLQYLKTHKIELDERTAYLAATPYCIFAGLLIAHLHYSLKAGKVARVLFTMVNIIASFIIGTFFQQHIIGY